MFTSVFNKKAFGVYTNKEWLEDAVEDLNLWDKCAVKEFENCSEAKQYAIDGYNSLQASFDDYFDDERGQEVKLNSLYYWSCIRRENKEYFENLKFDR